MPLEVIGAGLGRTGTAHSRSRSRSSASDVATTWGRSWPTRRRWSRGSRLPTGGEAGPDEETMAGAADELFG